MIMNEGIFGIVNFDKQKSIDRLLLMKMAGIQEGTNLPERDSCICKGNVGLGMIRLSRIKDQSTKPPCNELGSVFAVLIGEIFNLEDLKVDLVQRHEISTSTDIQLVTHLYEEYGDHFAKKLNGTFTIALWDATREKLLLIQDRFGGAQALYWTKSHDRLVFGTKIKSLLRINTNTRKINQSALNYFLKYSYIPPPHTIFEEIEKITPGTILIFQHGKIRLEDYWGFDVPDEKISDEAFATRKYLELLSKSIKRRLQNNDADVGTLLSGGMDSGANLALASQFINRPLKTFSIGFKSSEFDESFKAEIIANHFKTKHHVYKMDGSEIDKLPELIWHLEEPYFEDGLLLSYTALNLAKSFVDTVLVGDGNDQLFGAKKAHILSWRTVLQKTHTYNLMKTVKMFTENSLFTKNDLLFAIQLGIARIVDFNDWYFYGFNNNELRKLRGDKSFIWEDLYSNSDGPSRGSFAALCNFCTINLDIKNYLCEGILLKTKKMAEMCSITVRTPFLDNEVVDFVNSLDLKLKAKGNFFNYLKGDFKTKYIHRLAMQNRLPEEVQSIPKQGGFVPLEIFFQNEKRCNFIINYLRNSHILKEYFDINYIRNMLDYRSKMSDLRKHGLRFRLKIMTKIFHLLVWDVWFRMFVLNSTLEPPESFKISDYLEV